MIIYHIGFELILLLIIKVWLNYATIQMKIQTLKHVYLTH